MGSINQLDFGLDRYMPHCRYCGYYLRDSEQRAIEHTQVGPKYFCRSRDDGTGDSCFLRWKRRHP
jgi:hypothetical protein